MAMISEIRSQVTLYKADTTKRRLLLSALLVIALVGAAARTRHYLVGASLWHDEAALAASFLERNLGELLSRPLEFMQSAPPLFLALVYLSTVFGGLNEFSLRIVPYLSAMLMPFVSVVAAPRIYRTPSAQLTFVALVSFSPVLIHYSAEFKQYSSEALATLSIVTAAGYRNTKFGILLFAVVGAIALLLSNTAVIVLAPLCVLLLLETLGNRRFLEVVACGFCLCSGFLISMLYLRNAGVNVDGMHNWWSQFPVFAPWPPSSLQDFAWYAHSVWELVKVSMTQGGGSGPVKDLHFPSLFEVCLTLIFVVSAACALIRGDFIAICAAASIALLFVLSGMSVYPLSGRLVIFAVPLIILLFAGAVDLLATSNRTISAAVVGIVIASFPVWHSAQVVIWPKYVSDMRGAVAQLNGNADDGELLLITSNTEIVFQFYKRYITKKLNVNSINTQPIGEGADHILDIAAYNSGKRIWFLVGWQVRKGLYLLKTINRLCQTESYWSNRDTVLVGVRC